MARTLFFALHALALLGLYAAGLDSLFTWLLFLALLGTFALGLADLAQTEHSLRRNFPLFARARWVAEHLRPFVRQYLLESDMDGAPINRMFRSIVYQRAKGDLDTVPFGTRVDTYREGYEWIGHSIAALNLSDLDRNPRVRIGGPDCARPYDASILNISAMSFGALSANAVRALNKGAGIGGFYQNTGEGGLSDYHRAYGGDLTWQIGTGYFGCRNPDGSFSPERFADTAALDAVRMIEVKLSQGAKPGHGGILPASKNDEVIARIRGVEPNTEVVSPSAHTAFDSPRGLLEFIARLRTLAGGKPVGFKLAIGHPWDWFCLARAMRESASTPDFIVVDGAEGGTGAAPLEFINRVGMPMREGLRLVHNTLVGLDLRDHVKLGAAGKITSSFHIFRTLALGADWCNSARGFMFALGCIQAVSCHSDRCPSGIATQDRRRWRNLDPLDKAGVQFPSADGRVSHPSACCRRPRSSFAGDPQTRASTHFRDGVGVVRRALSRPRAGRSAGRRSGSGTVRLVLEPGAAGCVRAR